jgi:hypothetical protein
MPAMTHHRPPRRRAGILGGCLIALAVLLVILLIGGWYVYSHWKGWAATVVQKGTEAVVAESGLPDTQKSQILADVQSLSNDFKDGKISLDQLSQVMKEIADSPLLPLAGVQAARTKYIETSDMKPEEKAAAILSLQRFARGIYEKKITPAQSAIDDAVKPITTLKPDGRWELKERPTRQELDQFIANVKAKADAAKIPEEPFDLNIAAELRKAIDKALGRAPTK